jgi:integrase
MKYRTLRDFFEQRYLPDDLDGGNIDQRKRYRSAINRLAKFLDREPLIVDLTAANFRNFHAWLMDSGFAMKSRYNTQSSIRRLWRAAEDANAIAVSPPQRLYGRTPTKRPTPSDPRALLTLFRERYMPLRLLGRAISGIRQHEIVIGHFRRFLGREPVADDLTDEDISRFAAYLLSVRSQRHVTVNKSIDKILAQWRFLQRKGVVTTYPEIRKLSEPAIIPKCWLLDEIERLLMACRETEGTVAGVQASVWWQSLHFVIWDTGERIGAILGLRWDDVDLDAGWLTIRAELRKGKKKPIMRRLRAETLVLLRAMVLPSRELIFPWDRHYGQVWRCYKEIRKRAGLNVDRRSGFHRMRRSVASYFKQAGGDATELLDHSARSVTQAYLDPRIVTQVQAMDLLPPIGRKAASA